MILLIAMLVDRRSGGRLNQFETGGRSLARLSPRIKGPVQGVALRLRIWGRRNLHKNSSRTANSFEYSRLQENFSTLGWFVL